MNYARPKPARQAGPETVLPAYRPGMEAILHGESVDAFDLIKASAVVRDSISAIEGRRFIDYALGAAAANAIVTRQLQSGIRPEVPVYRLADEWQASGLKAHRHWMSNALQGLYARPLIDSLANGEIKALSIVNDGVLRALNLYFRQYLVNDIVIGGADLPPPRELSLAEQGYTPTGVPYAEFVLEAFRQIQAEPYAGEYYKGIFTDQLSKPSDDAQMALGTVKAGLDLTILPHEKYRSFSAQAQFDGLSSAERMALADIRVARIYDLKQLGSELTAKDKRTDLSASLLDDPGYHRQEQGDTCANAAFRMVFNGLTNAQLNESDVQDAVKSIFGNPYIDNEAYLNVLHSQMFYEAFGQRPVTRVFRGMSLAGIANITNTIKIKQPQAKVYVVVNLQSESSETGIWHVNPLLSANYHTVICHDPAPSSRNGDKQAEIGCTEFYKRWAVTGNSGYIVIGPATSVPTPE